MANNYNAYVAAADVAIRWEKATDMLDNGIVIHHITQDTQEAFTMIRAIRRNIKTKTGLSARMTWLDQNTLKIVWY